MAEIFWSDLPYTGQIFGMFCLPESHLAIHENSNAEVITEFFQTAGHRKCGTKTHSFSIQDCFNDVA